MTLYAPPTDRQAYKMVARRLLIGRPAVMALCVTAFVSSIVTSGHSTYTPGDPSVTGMAQEEIAITQASLVLPVPSSLVSAQEIAATLPRFDDASTMMQAMVKAEHPRFEARPLPDDTFVYERFDGVEPHQPEATIQMASLAPPHAPEHFEGDRLFPRMPDTTSLAIIPPKLSTQDHRDDSTGIDVESSEASSETQDGHQLKSVRAKGGETLESVLDTFIINEDDKLATLVALRADDISETLSPDDRIDLAYVENRKLGENKLVAIRLDFDEDGKGDGRTIELRWDGETHDLWASLKTDEAMQAEIYSPITTTKGLDNALFMMGEPERVFVQGTIETSLYAAADDAGMTPGEAKTLTDVFRYLIDFERDLRVGDRFEVMFDKMPNGDFGDIVYAMIENRGRQIALYRGKTTDAGHEYFDAEGKTNRRALMRTPLAYNRISSQYGMRKHPIDGYRKMHRGVDFSARTGTPVVAAGNGTVDYVGRRGGYGKYIRIRHNKKYKTAYAHLSRYAKGLKNGSRVTQGEVIGYVGSTGRSTGPHLHFEVLENGKQINPMKVGDFGPIRSLNGPELARFKAGIARINLVLAELRPKTVVATAE